MKPIVKSKQPPPLRAPAPPPAPPGETFTRPSELAWGVLTSKWVGIASGSILLAAMTLWAYRPAIRSGFIWDDDDYVEKNLTLRTREGLWKMWTQMGAIPQYYPMTHTTFWIEYQLGAYDEAHNPTPFSYHLTNVLLHLTNALLFWAVLRRLGLRGAYAAGLLFAAHPAMVESAAWITERKNVLSMAFYLGAVLAYMRFDPFHRAESLAALPPRGSRWVFYGLSLFLFACALLSKTVTCTLPGAILLLAWWKRGRWRWGQIAAVVPMLVIGGALAGITIWMEKTHVGAEGEAWSLSWLGHVLLAARIAWFYLGKLLWPAEIMFFYPRWKVDPSQGWQYLYPAAALGLVVALWLLRKRLGRGPLTAVLFFGATLFPALGFINVYPMRFSYVADHFQYHASLGIFALAAGLGAWAFSRWQEAPPWVPAGLLAAVPPGLAVGAWLREGAAWASQCLGAAAALAGATVAGSAALAWRHRRPPAGAVWAAGRTVAAGAVAAVLAALAWRQGHDYQDRETLWQQTIRKNPSSWISYNNLACISMQEANTVIRLNATIPKFQKAMELYALDYPGQTYDDAVLNLGIIHLRKGDFEDANSYFTWGFALKPKHAALRNQIGMEYWKAKRPLDALRWFRETVAVDSNYADAYNNIGFIYETQGLRKEAIETYQKALSVRPEHADAHFNLGQVYALEDPNKALEEFRKALSTDPNHVKAMDGIAEVLNRQGRHVEAMEQGRRALAIDGNMVHSLGVVAAVLATCDDPNIRNGQKAMEYALRLDRLTDGSDVMALDVLACAHAEMGDYRRAVETAQKACDLAVRLGRQQWAEQIRSRLQLYQAGRPYHRGPAR